MKRLEEHVGSYEIMFVWFSSCFPCLCCRHEKCCVSVKTLKKLKLWVFSETQRFHVTAVIYMISIFILSLLPCFHLPCTCFLFASSHFLFFFFLVLIFSVSVPKHASFSSCHVLPLTKTACHVAEKVTTLSWNLQSDFMFPSGRFSLIVTLKLLQLITRITLRLLCRVEKSLSIRSFSELIKCSNSFILFGSSVVFFKGFRSNIKKQETFFCCDEARLFKLSCFVFGSFLRLIDLICSTVCLFHQSVGDRINRSFSWFVVH